MTLAFFSRFEYFAKGCDKGRYYAFMRRWESNRADFEACATLGDLLRLLAARLEPQEQAQIKVGDGGKWLTITGPDFRYVTRVYTRESERCKRETSKQ